jgi:hypothetical protein
MNYLKQALQSKTIWFGLLLSIASWVQTVVVAAPLPPEVVGIVGSVIGAIVVWLRTQTNVPLSQKGAKPDDTGQ